MRGGGGRGGARGRAAAGLPHHQQLQFAAAEGRQQEAGLRAKYRAARGNGQLNLSSMGLRVVPREVFALADCLEEDEKFWEVWELSKLDLSFNELTTLSHPELLGNLAENLRVLIVRSNALTQLPPEVFALHNLQQLDVSGNQLQNLPPRGVSAMRELMQLRLQENRLSSLPEELVHCSRLQFLDVSSNALVALPEGLGSLSGLQQLFCAQNRLQTLPPSVVELSVLRILDARANQIRALPAGMAGLGALSVLDMRENALRSLLPPGSTVEASNSRTAPRPGAGDNRRPQRQKNRSSRGLEEQDEDTEGDQFPPRLAQLFVGHNSLERLPVALFEAVQDHLVELHVQGNQLRKVPAEIGLCGQLKVVDVSNNEISDLPASLGRLRTLNRIILDGNPLRALKRAVLSMSCEEVCAYLRTREDDPEEEEGEKQGAALEVRHRLGDALASGTMDLSSMELQGMELPEEMLHLDSPERVTQINLSQNDLFGIPRALRTFPSLTSLTIDHNVREMEFEPACLLHLPLTHLSLAHSHLTEAAFAAVNDVVLREGLSARWELVERLQTLCLDGNGLTMIPPFVFVCMRLDTLQLKNNSIRHIDGPWENFSALHRLALGDNQIRSIESLLHCASATGLQQLDLENNDIGLVPPELSQFTALTTLNLYGNPQRGIRTHVLQQGSTVILAALARKMPVGRQPASPEAETQAQAQVQAQPQSHAQTAAPTRAYHQLEAPPQPPTARATAMAMATSSAAPGSSVGGGSATYGGGPSRPPVDLHALQEEVRAIEAKMEAPSCSQASRHGLKKMAAKVKAQIIREERRRREEAR